MAVKRGVCRIGTSNVVIPGNKSTFPVEFQAKSRLNYYSSLFNTVELNQTFYKTPMPTTFVKWMLDVPDHFQFSLKLTRDITHDKKLMGDLVHLEKFIEAAKGVGEKKGCLLIQFPGKITLDHFAEVEEILRELVYQDQGNEWRKAVEFRHASWYVGETYELLNEFGATVVLHDIPKGRMMDFAGKAKFVYQRFHGPKGDYRDSYSESFLKEKAKQIKKWMKEGKDVFVYFNNTIGQAFDNAKTLQSLI